MNIDRVIWDFNGTIIDDVLIGIQSADELLRRYGLPPIGTKERYYQVFGFPIIDYYRRLGFDFTKVDYDTLANEWVAIYLERARFVPLREGVLETVLAFDEERIPQTVLSMTEKKMLIKQLTALGIADYFEDICGKDDIFASGKEELARAWHRVHPGERAIYIGDSSHDAVCADIIGAECFLLSGGHESDDALLATGKTVIHHVDEVLSQFNRFI